MKQDICIRGLPQMFLNLSNIINVHIPILNGLEELYHELTDTLVKAVDHVQDHIPERNNSGVISVAEVDRYLTEVGTQDGHVQEGNEGLQSAYNALSDLVSVSMPSTTTYDNALTRLNGESTRIRDNMGSLNITLTALTDLLATVRNEIGLVGAELAGMGVNSSNDTDWSITEYTEGFAEEMSDLRIARQDAAFEGEFSQFGFCGGWFDYFDHRMSREADEAFWNYIEADLQTRVDSLFEGFMDENGELDTLAAASDLFHEGMMNGFTETQWEALVQLVEGMSLEEAETLFEAMSIAPSFPPLATPPWDIQSRLEGEIAARLEAAFEARLDELSDMSLEDLLNELGRNMDGTFDLGEDEWATVEFMLGLPYESMTDEMFMALEQLLMQLDDTGFTEFFLRMAEEVELDPPATPLNTSWTFCEDTLGRLQSGIAGMGEAARLLHQHLYGVGMENFFADDEFADLRAEFSETFRDINGELPASDQALWDFMMGRFEDIQNTTFERRAILEGVMGLGNILGENGAAKPNFDIIGNSEDGFTISTVRWEIDFVMFTGTDHGGPAPHDVTITPVLAPRTVYRVARDDVRDIQTEVLSFNLGESLAKDFVNIYMGAVIGTGGDIAGVALGSFDAGVNISQGQIEAAENIEQFNSYMDNTDIGHMALDLEISGISIDDGDGAPQLMLQATIYTEASLAIANAELPDDVPDVQLEYVFDNPGSAFDILFPNPLE